MKKSAEENRVIKINLTSEDYAMVQELRDKYNVNIHRFLRGQIWILHKEMTEPRFWKGFGDK